MANYITNLQEENQKLKETINEQHNVLLDRFYIINNLSSENQKLVKVIDEIDKLYASLKLKILEKKQY